MSKKYLLLLSAIFLIGCDSNSTNNSQSTSSMPSNSDKRSGENTNNIPPTSVINDNKVLTINKKCELDFYNVAFTFNNNY